MISENFKIDMLFDLSHTQIKEFISTIEFGWQIVPKIKNIILEYSLSLDKNDYFEIKKNAFVHKNTKISQTAYIDPPCIIDEGCEIRHSAFIRGNVIVGKNCVIGNSTEVKNSLLFDEVKIPHFNYVGDSILGYKTHLGAGVIISNVKSDKSTIKIKMENTVIDTNLKKLGAIVGDKVEVGCNSVLTPGVVVGKNVTIYPLSFVRGCINKNCIYKNKSEIIGKK